MIDIQRAVLFSLLYADIFGSAVDHEVLFGRLQTDTKISKKTFEKAVEILKKEKKIIQDGSYYSVTGGQKNISQSMRLAKVFDHKIEYVRKMIAPVMRLNFVQGVFITGSLAVKNSDENDDIDLMIVTSKHRLWLTRFVLIVYSEIMGVRKRPHDTDVKDKLCFNMFLEEDMLCVPEHKQNLYSAYEVIQALPLLVKGKLDQRFVYDNRWIQQYFGNFTIKKSKMVRSKSVFLVGPFLTMLNYLFYFLQLLYMSRKKTTEFVEYNRAFFHPRPTKKIVLKAFESGKKRFRLV